MEDCILLFDMLGQRAGVPHVLFNEGGPGRVAADQPFQVAFGPRAAEVVENGRMPALVDQMDRGVDAEEAGAAGDQRAPLGSRLGAARAGCGSRSRDRLADARGWIHGGTYVKTIDRRSRPVSIRRARWFWCQIRPPVSPGTHAYHR